MLTNEISTNNEFTPKRKIIRSELDDPFYSEENIARLKKSIEQLERGQVVEKTLDELKQFIQSNRIQNERRHRRDYPMQLTLS